MPHHHHTESSLTSPFQRFRQGLKNGALGRFFKTNEERTQGAVHAGGGLCCSALSLDEAANAANGANNAASGKSVEYSSDSIHIPHGPTEIGIGATAGYLSLGGAVVSAKIFRRAGKMEKEFSKALQSEKLRPATHTPETATARRYLREGKKEQTFQRRWTGALPALGSALTFGGLFFKPLAAAGLLLMAGAGAKHCLHEIQAYRNAGKARSRAERDADGDPEAAAIRERFFSQERTRRLFNAVGWGAFAAGAGILGASTAAALATGATLFPPALLIAGVTGVFGGAAATLIYNNMLTGPRFSGFPDHDPLGTVLDKEGKPLSNEKANEALKEAARLRRVTKKFRRDTLQSAPLYRRAGFQALRMGQKGFGLATLGLLNTANHALKHWTRNVALRAVPDTPEAAAARLRALQTEQAAPESSADAPADAFTALVQAAKADGGAHQAALKGLASSVLGYKRKKQNGAWQGVPYLKSSFLASFPQNAKPGPGKAATLAQALHEASAKSGHCCSSHHGHDHDHDHHHEHDHDHREEAPALEALFASPQARKRYTMEIDRELGFVRRTQAKKNIAVHARYANAAEIQKEAATRAAQGR